VRAWYFGARFLVEIHVVLDADTPLREAHDVGEKLELMVVRVPIFILISANYSRYVHMQTQTKPNIL